MTSETHVITSHPFRSLNVQGVRWLLGAVATANLLQCVLVIAIGGAPVIPFLGLDLLLLYAALRWSFRQARMCERISIGRGKLVIEHIDPVGRISAHELPSYWARVIFDGDESGGDVCVASHGRVIPVGIHIPGPERARFADELRQALSNSKRSGFET